MKWYGYLGYFLVGAFLVNSIPHLVQGITGQEFQTPFGALSLPIVNVVWGFINLAVGYSIATILGGLSFAFDRRVGMTALGFLATAIMLAYAFG